MDIKLPFSMVVVSKRNSGKSYLTKHLLKMFMVENKLFDYIQAKTPVVATYLPEIKTIISTYKIGEIIRSHSPEDIANAIKLVCDNGKTYYQKNLEKASKELIWENQESKLLSLFINA